jgi:phosphoribosyl 1,2-cyclic phosphate phosphodiesterase
MVLSSPYLPRSSKNVWTIMSITTGRLLFLGTGASMGTPVIGCSCDVCMSQNPHNRRLRSSVLCQIDHKNILIDCGPDFRQQALMHQIDHLDGLIFTHAHNDHTAGIDELRVFRLRKGDSLPCLLSSDTAVDLRIRFKYIFEEQKSYSGLIPHFSLQEFEKDRGDLVFHGIKLKHFSYQQLGMRVDGLRFGNLAYVSDIKHYPETIFEDLAGVKTLIVSALRFQPTKMHFSVDDAVEFSRKVGAEKTWLMHISHDLDHDIGNAYLPDDIRMAYDGLELPFQVEILLI